MTAAAMASTSCQESLLEARGLCLSFGDHAVLDDVDVTVSRGEIVTLIGPNGSGKSTLVRIILGLLAPQRGQVSAKPGLRIGYTPQHLAVDPTLPLTVARFLALGARVPRRHLQALMDEVGAGPVLDRQLADISGGELHRVVLARALLRRPDLLVLDEPMSGVDLAGQSELYRLIADIRDRHRCGVLLVSHDIHLVMAATDTVICLNHHVCCTGRPHAVVRDPAFVALFGRETAEVLAVYEHQHDHRHEATGEIVPIDIAAVGAAEARRPAHEDRRDAGSGTP
jgi:zinc transport system ATP-binding protein